MLGFRVKLNDLPEQAGELKIPLHRLFLPMGLFLIGIGVFCGYRYIHTQGPSDEELHLLKLRNVSKVVTEREIPESETIDNIWLYTTDGTKIHYRLRFPFSNEVIHRDSNYGLLLDKSNVVWGVMHQNVFLERNYFLDYNIERRTVDKACGGFLGVLGLYLVTGFIYIEHRFRKDLLPKKENIPVRVRRLVFISSLLGSLAVWVFVLVPLLQERIPGYILMITWPLFGGLVGNALVSYFKKHPPDQTR